MTEEEIKNRMYILAGHMLNIDMHGWTDINEDDRRAYYAMRTEYEELKLLCAKKCLSSEISLITTTSNGKI